MPDRLITGRTPMDIGVRVDDDEKKIDLNLRPSLLNEYIGKER